MAKSITSGLNFSKTLEKEINEAIVPLMVRFAEEQCAPLLTKIQELEKAHEKSEKLLQASLADQCDQDVVIDNLRKQVRVQEDFELKVNTMFDHLDVSGKFEKEVRAYLGKKYPLIPKNDK